MGLLLRIFFVFFKIGFFAVGGAYSFLPLVEKEVVRNYGWLSSAEFLDITGITAVFPGAISIKYATYIGYEVAGVPGVIAANLGNLLPPVLLITGVGYLYKKYGDAAAVEGAFKMIRIAVFAMIISAAFELIGLSNLASGRLIIFAMVFGALFFWGRLHPAYIVLTAGILGAFIN